MSEKEREIDRENDKGKKTCNFIKFNLPLGADHTSIIVIIIINYIINAYKKILQMKTREKRKKVSHYT